MTVLDRPALEAIRFAVPASRWDEAAATGMTEAELLLYRSNLLGSDLTVTNFGGGNTSAKITETDPLTGQPAEVLWVKGSGGDIGSMKLDGFATLYQDKLLALEGHYAGEQDDDKMVGFLPHCTFNLNGRAASIDTQLHSLLPYRHIDHVHPDAIIALAASSNGEAVTKEIWGDEIGWLPWKRPGFTLGVMIRDFARANPQAKGAMLAGHGIICWADTAKDCYEQTVRLIAQAADYLNNQLAGKPAFGGAALSPEQDGAAIASQLMPRLRALMTGARRKIGHFADDPASLEFVCSADFARLAALGTSCPDHFLRTKIAPLVLDPSRMHDDAYLAAALEDYRALYAAYYERCKRANSPAVRDANPVIYLIPGVGMLSFAKDKATARIAGEFYVNAINVMREANAVDQYIGLPEQEAFDIEYWLLEEAKLQRMPRPKPMVGKVALVTGGSRNIGAWIAEGFIAQGAKVYISSRKAEDCFAAAEELGLAPGTPVAQGGVDAYVGALGLGVVEPGKIALITGSSHVMIGQVSEPIHDPGFWGAYTDAMVPGQYTVEAGQASTGSVVAWAKLSGRMSGKPLLLPGRHLINLGVLAAIIIPVTRMVREKSRTAAGTATTAMRCGRCCRSAARC